MSHSPFQDLAELWWQPDGPFRTLHEINPLRVSYIQNFVSLAGLEVLDLGCGGGILSEALAKKGASVLGIDIATALIAVAQQHAQQHHLKIDYQAIEVERLQHQQFDAIVCMEMLEHVEDPGVIIKHCARLLKPGGYLFLSTIARNLTAYLELIVLGEYLLKLLPRQTHDYRLFINPSEMLTDIHACELELKDIKGLSYHPFTHQVKLTDYVQANYLMCVQKPKVDQEAV